MATVEHEFREFVVGFADPLTRLAFLLTAGGSGDPAALSADALARVRRQWHDAEVTGAPESLAVEALLSALPHARQFHRRGLRPEAPADAEYVLAGAGAAIATVNHEAFRRPVAPVEGPTDASLEGAVDGGVDVDVLHDLVWKAWQRLTPRQRVPLVFVDASVASRRLAGLGVPESFASARRLDVLGAVAMAELRTTLAADPTVGAAVDKIRGRRFAELLADTLREHASAPARVIDPYPTVVEQAQRLRRRAVVAVAAVLVVLAVGFVVAVLASQPTKETSAAATASPSASPTLAPTGGSPTAAGGVGSQGPIAEIAQPTGPVLVVGWSPRGNAVKDSRLLANLKSYFATVHGDATGQTQVLLAADTSTVRIAYVTSNSRNGVIQSWFYGPVGSDSLVEGATSYGGAMLPDSIIADGLIDGSGDEYFVVIAPPDTTGMQIADFDFTKPAVTLGFSPLPYQNGIAVKRMTAGTSASSFVVDVSVGSAKFTVKDAPDIQLKPNFTGSVTSNGPPSRPLPTPPVERGQADQTLLTEALRDAAVWEGSNPVVAARPVVVWAGVDDAGTKLVVLRVKTKAYDVLVVEWSGAAPGDHAEYLVDPAAPDVPIAFAYRALDGTRVGVIAPGSSAMVILQAAAESGPYPLDSTGFVSFVFPNPPPAPNNDASGALGVVAKVQLLNAAGHPIGELSVPPSLGG
jgi:hypothetical protein